MGIKLKGLLIVAVLVTAVVLLLPSFRAYRSGGDPSAIRNKVTLGLDLQGGMYLDVGVDLDAAELKVLDNLAEEIEGELLDLFLDDAIVERRGRQVEVLLPAGESVDWNAEPWNRLLRSFSRNQAGEGLEVIRLLEEERQRIREGAVNQALEVIRTRVDSLGVSEPSIQRQGRQNLLIQLPGLRDRESAINAIGTQALLEFYLVVDDASPRDYDPQKQTLKDFAPRGEAGDIPEEGLVLERRPVLAGDTIRDARVSFSPLDNTPYVSVSFDSVGQERFARITQQNRGRRLAIVLDDRVRSAPVIREAITGGEAQISGGFTLDEATNLVLVLRSGALPAPIDLREERTVGPTLGQDSIRQGLLALAAGFLLVLIFMTAYYKVSGLFAAFALLCNVLLILAALALFQATLTLPGIAGIVLTIGMSVDANVLIFQRIREEIALAAEREGKLRLREAINEGFARAFGTIFDANITTLVAALALLTFGTGPVRGFAVTLTIGILASLFTAVIVTRFFFDLVYGRPNLKRISI